MQMCTFLPNMLSNTNTTQMGPKCRNKTGRAKLGSRELSWEFMEWNAAERAIKKETDTKTKEKKCVSSVGLYVKRYITKTIVVKCNCYVSKHMVQKVPSIGGSIRRVIIWKEEYNLWLLNKHTGADVTKKETNYFKGVRKKDCTQIVLWSKIALPEHLSNDNSSGWRIHDPVGLGLGCGCVCHQCIQWHLESLSWRRNFAFGDLLPPALASWSSPAHAASVHQSP